MAASVLPETASFQAAVALINKVDVAKFPAVVTRLLKKLHLKVSAACLSCTTLYQLDVRLRAGPYVHR